MQAKEAYHYLTYHIVPGPQSFSYFIPLILLPIALLTTRAVLKRWQSITLFLPCMVVATGFAWKAIGGIDVITVDVLLWALYLLVLKDPWKDFMYLRSSTPQSHRVEGTDPSASTSNDNTDAITSTITETTPLTIDHEISRKDGDTYPSSLISRIPWVGRLLTSIRLNNWKIGQPSHDKHQPPAPAFTSRTQFVLHTILAFCRGYLILDLTSAYTQYDHYFKDPTISISSPFPLTQLQFLPSQFLRSMIIGAQAWALIGQMFYLPCLLPVGLNAIGLLSDDWSPHNWAPYYGSPRVIFLHGVRGFWGQYWHQMMRHSTSGPGYAIADALGLKSGGLLKYTIITTIAFGLSGIVHMGLVPPEPLHAIVSANRIRLYVASFFWMQPIAMLAEVVLIRIGRSVVPAQRRRSAGTTRLTMVCNTIWVIIWFSLSLPLIGEAGRQLGYWSHWLVPVSIWKALRGEDCIAWPLLRK